MALNLRLRSGLGWLADWQIIPVACLAPAFLLADRLPAEVLLVAVLAIPLLWCTYRVVRGRFFTPTPADIPLLLLAATVPIGVWAAAVPAFTLPSLLQALFGLTLFYAMVNSLTDCRKVQWAGYATLLGAALLAGLGLAGTAWGSGSKFLPFDLRQYLPYLLSGVWHSAGFNPNIVGGALAVLAPVTAAYAWAARAWPRRLLLWLLLAGEVLTLVLTQSRGALMGFAVALMVVAIGRDRRWAWAVLMLTVAVIVGAALYGFEPALALVMETAGDSIVASQQGRLELLSRGLYMLQDFPFTGVGLGMFPRVLVILYPLFSVAPGTEVAHVHNIYLQMGIDHGLPGLIAYLAFLLLLGLMGIQAIRLSGGRPWEPLAIGLLAGLAAYLLHGLTDAVWHTPRSHPIIWVHFGLLTAVWCWARAESLVE